MDIDYQTLTFPYRPSEDSLAREVVRHPVIVVGAGPVGLAVAIDLAQHGVRVVLLDDDCSLATGSRAICFAKRTLEIFDRLGCGERVAAKGVRWNVGRVFFQNEPVYSFDLLPEPGHERPAFVNLQQYFVEGYLAERAAQLPNLDIRWKHKVVGVTQDARGVALTVQTPDGEHALEAEYVVAADGAKSALRALLNLDVHGRTFKDRFLIADVRMKADFPAERWFWFDPPFHRHQSVLLHRQPDNLWRIDFQLGWDADPVLEKTPERVIPRVCALLGADAEFELVWVSVYTFHCERLDAFRHGRIVFAGDAAHGVSPFGARGANGGVQDADNLAWKLALVLQGHASERLIDSYAVEREFAADENIRHSTRSTDFITPKSDVSRLFRDATLALAKDCAFARKLVNSGRLSLPAVLSGSPLNTPDQAGDAFVGAMVPGAPASDAPVKVSGTATWLLRVIGGRFTGLFFCGGGGATTAAAEDADEGAPLTAALVGELAAIVAWPMPVRVLVVAASALPALPPRPGIDMIEDCDGLVAARYDARPGTFYLLRPDQHVCARWRAFDTEAVRAALARAIGAHGDTQ